MKLTRKNPDFNTTESNHCLTTLKLKSLLIFYPEKIKNLFLKLRRTLSGYKQFPDLFSLVLLSYMVIVYSETKTRYRNILNYLLII